MPAVTAQRHRRQLPIGDLDAQRIGVLVQLGADPQARAVRRWRQNRTGPGVVRVMRAPRYWRSAVVAWVEGNAGE